ncbi:hypothetical protein C8J56DRAFT_920783 [Mycena floridula]|nr:hypothetical protein C8J56DRAFT_920783 [Mycena floridula]
MRDGSSSSNVTHSEDKDVPIDTPKARRPLPTPSGPPPQRPTSPVGLLNSPIPPSTFYGAPPLPARPKGIGSQHTVTAFIPTENELPDYSSDYREPEIAPPEPIMTLDVPDSDWNRSTGTTAYGDPSTFTDSFSWDDNQTWSLPWPESTPFSDSIDGRMTSEEESWWDSTSWGVRTRPGPGILAPLVAEDLPDHAFYKVTPVAPESRVTVPAAPTDENPPSSSLGRQDSSPTPSQKPRGPPPPPPSEEELQNAVPHPYAYFCPKENGWILLHTVSSTFLPPLIYPETMFDPELPSTVQRDHRDSCLDVPAFEKPHNLTHHFHKYENVVDARKLSPPYHVDEWETIETVKQKRRAGTIITEDIDLEKMKDEDMPDDEVEREGKLLDLYICCQCRFMCISSSSIIPGVIPKKPWDDLISQKRSNPLPGKTADQSVVLALETLVLALENILWKGEHRMLRVDRPGFQRKIGWNPTVNEIFEALGFQKESVENQFSGLRPPATDLATPQERQNRAKLLRAWVEVSACLVEYIANHRVAREPKNIPISLRIESARGPFQQAIGSDAERMPRGSLDYIDQSLLPYWKQLGMTPTTYSPALLAFAYLAQCRCDPAGTYQNFNAFATLVADLIPRGGETEDLNSLLASERSRDRFDVNEWKAAAKRLGFGENEALKVELDHDIPEEFIINAWRDAIKKTWTDAFNGAERQREINEALRIIAEERCSPSLRRKWEESKSSVGTPDRAYDLLEIPFNVEDQMVITIFNMRVDESPSQAPRMREALNIIAESRGSERLREFLQSGQDPGDAIATVGTEWPRGLNQLGNTCYLNSLLQYFYTIKDLRLAVRPMGKLDMKSVEDDKFTDDELKRHRVGGRLVTRREIVRSKRFIHHLASLFNSLECSESVAVTPSIELAKLALVTSKDEEDEETDKGGDDSSNDTDATLVDDVPSGYSPGSHHQSPRSPALSPRSVLGKRSRDLKTQRSNSQMDVDSPFTPGTDQEMTTPPPPLESSSKLAEPPSRDEDGDVLMRSGSPGKQAPPLPPRKTETSDSVMMFGKQHDVAECMDNCMFQIETALLKFDGMDEESAEASDKTSVVKRLFYGKTRQVLGAPLDTSKSRAPIDPKVELFSHLPVNVDEEGFDLYDGLGRYFDDVVEYEGQRVPMQMSLIDLPPLLQIQLQRVQFDRDTLQSWKSQAYVKFGETIYLDRFLDSADPQKRAQSKLLQEELNSCRDRIRALTRGKDGPFTSLLEHTEEFLSQSGFPSSHVDNELISQLHEERGIIQREIDGLRNRMTATKDNLEAIWKNDREVAYELTSVFIHRGTSPSWGHYFFYSRNLPTAPDSWFKYNDSDVSVINKDEVLADTTGSTANPYLVRSPLWSFPPHPNTFSSLFSHEKDPKSSLRL